MHAKDRNPPFVSNIKAETIRLKPGEDLKVKLDEYVKERHIQAAFILTCAGSLQQVTLPYANLTGTDTLTEKFEIISLTGTLAQSGSHLHVAISDSTGKTIGGHLTKGSIIYTTAEIVIEILSGVTFERETDDTFGYKELVIKRVEEDIK